MTRALSWGDVRCNDFGKCSLRLELAGRQFVTRARANARLPVKSLRGKYIRAAGLIQRLRKFMAERIDPPNLHEKTIPIHANRSLLSLQWYSDIFTIYPFYYPIEASQARAVFTQPQKPGRLLTPIIR